jgi:anti-sigma factor RsiW
VSAPTYACRDFVEDVTAYLEGSLPPERVMLIEAHLTDCPHCTEYLREMRLTIAATGSLAATDVERLPDDVRARLLEAFEQDSD